MYKNKKILAVIPARGGSKGIPHKNIINLCGKPLISYTIQAGMGSRYIDYVMVSTDDNEIAAVAKGYGAEVPFMRPDALATDTSRTVDAVLHTINKLREQGSHYDTLILLQPTQPLRTSEDIDDAIEKYMECGCRPLASVSEPDDHPFLMRSIIEGKLKPLLDILSSPGRRQDMPVFYRINGCIYINEIDEIDENTDFNNNAVPYVMGKSHSVDIDDPIDIARAEFYLKSLGFTI